MRSFQSSLKRVLPETYLVTTINAISSSTVFQTLGSKYLWAFLKLTRYKARSVISAHDFLIFAITLRSQLSVTKKTLRRYIIEGFKAVTIAGMPIPHPKVSGVFTVVNSMEYTGKSNLRPRLDFCGFRWDHIRA